MSSDAEQPRLRLEGVGKSFEGLHAVKSVCLTAMPGERRALLGPNGAGKTTLFNLIAGDLPPTTGKIFFRGEDITRLPSNRRAARGIARTFQITNLFFNLSVIDNMVLGAQALERTKFSLFRPLSSCRQLYDRGIELLARIGIEHLKDEQVRNLSYGVQRQIEIMLALTREPSMLLLDEPTAGLSPAETGTMVEVLRNLPPAITILIIEHDMDVAFKLAQNITVLHYGEVIAEGTVAEVQANKTVQDIYLGAVESLQPAPAAANADSSGAH
jgi:branched-chain amino acid transport system ATP-binding protein